MLYWSVLFFVLAIIAGLFGFAGISTAFVEIGQILFFLFLIVFIVSLFFSRRPPPNIR